MIREPLVFVATSDIAGKLRGKAFPAADMERRMRKGVGWTPTNVQITCFDAIADTPYGALDDLLLIPDPETETRIDFEDGSPAEHLFIGDICCLDDTPWECCTRSILKTALQRLEAVSGLTLKVAFEHEFQLTEANRPLGDAYSRAGYRENAVFGETLMAALRAAGLVPDTFMKEYGVDQFEVTVAPRPALRAADEAVLLRDITQNVARRLGDRATFTPMRAPEGVGNGVHIHMSLCQSDGTPATYDPTGVHGLSEVAGAFSAGIVRYVDAILALTAPSVLSYRRLTPHRWSAAYNNLGLRDREAALRICPTTGRDSASTASQFNLEYRAADPAASPYVALAALVFAGAQGIQDALPVPEATSEDLSLLDPATLADRGFIRLPQTLLQALDRFNENATVKAWFPGQFSDIYRLHKQGEMAFLADKDETALFAAYETAY
ncbi:MAG: glutamine synthetase family protein [Pseudomonadota bacterium]